MTALSQSEYCDLLGSAARRLGKAPAGGEQAKLARFVGRLRDRLARPPRILLLGEVNSGKSSLANLLIGEAVVPTSVVANSRFPIRFHHSAKPILSAVLRSGERREVAWSQVGNVAELPVERVDVGLPVERLRTFEVIDMPGTGNPVRDVSGFGKQLSLAHLPIWCTVATRAWKESERREWSQFVDARKARGILVVTQADLLADKGDLTKVLDRLHRETTSLFRAIVPVAIPDAMASSIVSGKPETLSLWVSSGGAQLEAAIADLLSGIAEHRVTRAKQALCRALQRRGLLTGQDGGDTRNYRPARGEANQELAATMSQLGADIFDALIPSNISFAALIPPLLGKPGQANSGSSGVESRGRME
jgi:hypothetical protein